jgi:hypothetical protein
MSSNVTPAELQKLRETLRQIQVFYEILPARADPSLEAPVDWFAVVLHAEADARHPLDGWEGPVAIAALQELVGFLVNQAADPSCELNLSPWYYTAAPPAADRSSAALRLFRSVSLAFSNLPAYPREEEPTLLAEIRAQLHKLNVGPIEIARG